jgi:FkbM family methyltransferase
LIDEKLIPISGGLQDEIDNLDERVTINYNLIQTIFSTFLERTIQKWWHIWSDGMSLTGVAIGISGARHVGFALNGNALMRLNKKYALGEKGSVIELPQDNLIYKHIKFRGTWELEESKLLACGLIRATHQKNLAVALLDIGANSGLVSLQAMNLANTENSVILFEPIPRHSAAIKWNLKELSNVFIYEFALGHEDGTGTIFTQETNHGNTSLVKSAVPLHNTVSTEINLVDTTKFSLKFLNHFDRYVIKSDTQGMDAVILSRLPQRIWSNCECAIIEVWALPEIEQADVDHLLFMLRTFDFIEWTSAPNNSISLQDVRNFWLSKSGEERNLHLRKL